MSGDKSTSPVGETPPADHHPTAGKFGRGKPLPYGAPRGAAVAEAVPLIRPSVRTGAPSPRGRLKKKGAPDHRTPRGCKSRNRSGGVGREKQ